jgi:hypothetical protein
MNLKMKTLIIGASENPERYANKAALSLRKHGHAIVQVGLKEGIVAGEKILTSKPDLKDAGIDTVTLYVSPKNQPEWYDYILDLKPRRIIFNPGTENPEFEEMAHQKGIQPLEACTLVMLATNQF